MPDNEFTDPADFMRDAAPGTLIYGMAADEVAPPAIEILIRESAETLTLIPPRPSLAVRAGVVDTERIPVPVVLFQFGEDLPVYPSFWNYHHARSPDDPRIVDLMDAEPRELIFKFFDESGVVRKLFGCRHTLGPFFRTYSDTAASLPPWTHDTFRRALDEIHARFPTPHDLWNAFLPNQD